ncbi:MAG: hypothetical protein HPY98_10065 [Ruminococcus sp.]|uniref:hypothetical protein n=1 Tax=Roseburia inulinivorans TaxID=360807 RepID=UPI0025D18E8E|nr:hypothetical protein [Ruminococcus sp.]MBS1399144.1 hypothetical protein [Ruminococcus sp.]
MSEKEKDLIVRISKAIPKLDKEKQSYVLGVAEGMILANEQACPKNNEKGEMQ